MPTPSHKCVQQQTQAGGAGHEVNPLPIGPEGAPSVKKRGKNHQTAVELPAETPQAHLVGS